MVDHNTHLQRFREQHPAGQVQVWLDAARLAARRGDAEAARHLLRSAAQADPTCVEAWLRLAWLTPDPTERRALLRRVLALQPGHSQARAELDRLERHPDAVRPAPLSVQAGPPKRTPARARRLALAALLLLAAALVAALLIWGPIDTSLARLFPTPAPAPAPVPTQTPREIVAGFMPQLDQAVAQSRWTRALELLAIMDGVDPANPDVRPAAVRTHIRYGQALARSGDFEDADAQFELALALSPGNAEAELWQQAARTYQSGEQALTDGDWDAAIEAFGLVLDKLPGTLDAAGPLAEAFRKSGNALLAAGDLDGAIEVFTRMRDRLPADPGAPGLLATAFRQRGIARQAAGRLEPARADLEAALALTPGDTEAQTHLEQVMGLLHPPKRIVIDITAQMFYAYENDKLVYSFLTSTGLPGQDTAPGHYQVLDKIPMAYSSIWQLQMPYWLGIYYVGTVENGIHALPIRPDGTVMWGGLLGTRQSYGCVILSTEAAELIYHWAEIGTVVDIHY